MTQWHSARFGSSLLRTSGYGAHSHSCGSETLPLEEPPAVSGDPALEAEGIEPARLVGQNDFNVAVVQRLPDAQIEIDFQAGLLVVKLMR